MDNRYLFRGKRVNNGKWVVGNLLPSAVFYDLVSITTHNNMRNGKIRVDPTTIGQCTGLVAAKSYRGESEADRLIFEGDIIRWNDNVDYKEDWETSSIEWCGKRDYPAFDMKYHDYDSNGLSHLLGAGYTIEIIGTIHDAKEGDNNAK